VKRWLRATSTAVQTRGNSQRPRSPNLPSRWGGYRKVGADVGGDEKCREDPWRPAEPPLHRDGVGDPVIEGDVAGRSRDPSVKGGLPRRTCRHREREEWGQADERKPGNIVPRGPEDVGKHEQRAGQEECRRSRAAQRIRTRPSPSSRHFSPGSYCGGGYEHVYCVVLLRPPRRSLHYASGARSSHALYPRPSPPPRYGPW
jgi:hypothetical protein